MKPKQFSFFLALIFFGSIYHGYAQKIDIDNLSFQKIANNWHYSKDGEPDLIETVRKTGQQYILTQ